MEGAGSVELSLLRFSPLLEPAKDDVAECMQVAAEGGEGDVSVEAKLGSITTTIETIAIDQRMDGGLNAWVSATSLPEGFIGKGFSKGAGRRVPGSFGGLLLRREWTTASGRHGRGAGRLQGTPGSNDRDRGGRRRDGYHPGAKTSVCRSR